MRNFLSKRLHLVTIAVVALYCAVTMCLYGGRLAFFAGHSTVNTSDVGTIPQVKTIYAENRWNGKSYWKPVDFDSDGTLPLSDFVKQMYGKMFPTVHAQDGRVMREGQANLPHYVHVVARRVDGTVFLDTWTHNIRTNAGINWQEGIMASATANPCNRIGLTNAAITPAATDTTLSSEITVNGLARTGTIAPGHTSAATTYTLANIFTCLTATQAAQAAAVFNDAYSGGTMCFEATFAQASLQVNDTLSVTWTITF